MCFKYKSIFFPNNDVNKVTSFYVCVKYAWGNTIAFMFFSQKYRRRKKRPITLLLSQKAQNLPLNSLIHHILYNYYLLNARFKHTGPILYMYRSVFVIQDYCRWDAIGSFSWNTWGKLHEKDATWIKNPKQISSRVNSVTTRMPQVWASQLTKPSDSW